MCAREIGPLTSDRKGKWKARAPRLHLPLVVDLSMTHKVSPRGHVDMKISPREGSTARDWWEVIVSLRINIHFINQVNLAQIKKENTLRL